MEIAKEVASHINFQKISHVLVIVTGGGLCHVMTPKGYKCLHGLVDRLRKYAYICDKEELARLQLPEDTLITPVTPYGSRIQYRVLELPELLDSSEITNKHQMEMAQIIFDNYKVYDGFVILHGTDTMAYTASTLSFSLENLNKTVCLTGSQLPLAEIRNDSLDNFFGSLLVAGAFLIPEVVLFFHNKLFRGNRASKTSCVNLGAFSSINMEPLAAFDVTLNVKWDLVQKY